MRCIEAVESAKAVALPAGAIAFDVVDGSLMLMRVTEQANDTGLFDVFFMDTRATQACSRPAPYVAESSNSLYDDGGGGFEGRFFAFLDPGMCRGSATPTIGAITLEFFPGAVIGETMTDQFGNIWYHLGS